MRNAMGPTVFKTAGPSLLLTRHAGDSTAIANNRGQDSLPKRKRSPAVADDLLNFVVGTTGFEGGLSVPNRAR